MIRIFLLYQLNLQATKHFDESGGQVDFKVDVGTQTDMVCYLGICEGISFDFFGNLS